MPRQTLPPSSKRIPLPVDTCSQQIFDQQWVGSYAMQVNAAHPQANALPLQTGSYASAQPTRLSTESYANLFSTTQPFAAHTFAPQSQPEFPIYVQPNPIEPLIPTFPHTFQPNCQSCQTSYSSHHSARSQIPEPEWGILPPQEVPEEGQIMSLMTHRQTYSATIPSLTAFSHGSKRNNFSHC